MIPLDQRAVSWVCALACLVLTGCAGYRLGPSNGMAPGARSVQVSPFLNKTLEPRLTDAVTHSVRKRLQQDGTFRVDTHDEGDIILTGTITDYVRSGLSYLPDDVVTPSEYWVHMTARVIARERSSGRVIVDRTVVGRTFTQVAGDLSSADRQAIPLLADDMARNITALLADGEW